MQKIYKWLIVVGVLILALVALNFLNFRLMRSTSENNFSIGTARTGETLPQEMAAPFNISYQVVGAERLADPLQERLLVELAALPTILEAMPVIDEAPETPLLVVEVQAESYLWTPFYARSTVTAVAYFASEGEITWQPGDTLVMQRSPAIKSEGEFTLDDRSWGLIAKPAYAQHLSQALASSIAAGLHQDVFTQPAGR